MKTLKGDRDKKAHGRNRGTISSLLVGHSICPSDMPIIFYNRQTGHNCVSGQTLVQGKTGGHHTRDIGADPDPSCGMSQSNFRYISNQINQVNKHKCFKVLVFYLPGQEPTRIVEGQPIWCLPYKSEKQWQNFGIKLSPQKMEPQAAFWKK